MVQNPKQNSTLGQAPKVGQTYLDITDIAAIAIQFFSCIWVMYNTVGVHKTLFYTTFPMTS